MGGHSLLSINALRQIEDKLGVKLDFRVLPGEPGGHRNQMSVGADCRVRRLRRRGKAYGTCDRC